ncbi:MAG: MFS transporter [Acidimicrobiales bacterium]|nr:MFS transporter [Acidimicrobiales bacterium]
MNKSSNTTLPQITPSLITLLAISTGIVVANLYYLQPLLHNLALDLHVGPAEATSAVTAIQVGYACGLLFVVPLGDFISRKKLAAIVLGLATFALLLSAVAQSFVLFEIASVLVGLTSVVTHILLPLAADMAPSESRGKVVAKVMSGLLTGILSARVFSGMVAQFFGWRTVYFLAAAMMFLLGLVLYVVLPVDQERTRSSYIKLLKSTWDIWMDEKVLRNRAWLGAMTFGGFSILWSTIAFLLSSKPYGYSDLVIGAFSLVGLVGIVAANFAGRLVDAGKSYLMTSLCSFLLLLSFVVLIFARHSLFALIVGIIVLDAAVQGMQITNQGIIFQLRPEARSRINSAYMVCYFIGASLGSFLAGVAYGSFGWTGTCELGIITGSLAIAGAIYSKSSLKSSTRISGESHPSAAI